jgi:hypothetical protein
MKHLKTYKLFESKTGLTAEQEEFLNMFTRGTWTYNPATGLVDVNGDFDCPKQELEDFKGIEFGRVSGGFDCWANKLTSLEGAPQEVGGNFYCSNNNLTSLEGAPQKVGGDFSCSNNRLTSLEGAPQEVGENFYCGANNLTSLEGAPQKVDGNFSCSSNKLTSLEGAPQKVGWIFSCSYNNLTSLEGAPQKVGGDFSCGNNSLTSLEGAPQEVGGDFYCDAFRLARGKWNPKGWLEVLKTGSPAAQELILTIFSVEELNKKIAKDPAGMIMKLKGVWNDESFKETRSKLVWPRGYADDAELAGDLDDIGF